MARCRSGSLTSTGRVLVSRRRGEVSPSLYGSVGPGPQDLDAVRQVAADLVGAVEVATGVTAA